MQDDLRPTNLIAAAHVQRIDQRRWYPIGLDTLHLSTLITDEMRMEMLRLPQGITQGVEPGPILSADTVHQLFAHKGVKRAIDRDGIDRAFHLFEDLRHAQGPSS